MSLFIKQEDTRTRLQQQIATELQEKARQRASGDLPDGVEDSAYINGTKKTTSLAWVWGLIFLAAIAIVIFIIIRALSR